MNPDTLGYPLRLGLLKHYLRHKNMVWGQSIIPPGELPGIALIVGVYDLPETFRTLLSIPLLRISSWKDAPS